MSIREEVSSMRSLLETMKDQMKMLDEMVDSSITSVYNLNIKIKDVISKINFEKIPEMGEDEILKILRDGASNEDRDENINALTENHRESEEWAEKPFIEYARHVIHSIKNEIMEVLKLQYEKEELEAKINEISDDYFNHVNTKEYKEKKLSKLNELRENAAEETDEVKRREIERMISYMEKSETLSFLMQRVEEKGQNEIDNIAKIFFDKPRSSLVMKKFAARLPKFGFSKDIYKYFFNLEENFLPEEYHIFNNLFLFHVMRTLSFMDINSKRDSIYTNAILIHLYNLVYHKFGDQEAENEFVEFIRKFDELFMDTWKDKFEKDNETAPNHPRRIKKEKESEEKRRLMTIVELQNHGVDPDTSLETNELIQLLKDTIEDEKVREKEEIDKWTQENSSKSEEDKSDEEDIISDDTEEVESTDNPSDEKENSEGMEFISEDDKVEEEVWVDKYGYYYRKTEDGTYTYYNRENGLEEEDILETTVLQLVNTESVLKEKRKF